VEIRPENRENEEREAKHLRRGWGKVNRLLRAICLGFVGTALIGAGALLAQETGKKASGTSAAAARGKSLFQQKCAVCHYDTSDQKKIGPGLKGISKRGTFSVNGNKITDASLTSWIENGDQLMPPFKDVLESGQIKDLVAYVKTL
jgi:cytochrome c